MMESSSHPLAPRRLSSWLATRLGLVAVLTLAFGSLGCGDDFPELMRERDTGADSRVDAADDASDEDASDDASESDSAVEDSATEDAATEDSAVEDSATEDSATEDSATEDSGTEDSGTDSGGEDAMADAEADSGEDTGPMVGLCGRLGQMCEERTECGEGETCFGSICLPMGQPICGGFAGALCDAGSGFPTCYFPVGSSGGTCVDGTQLDCVCDDRAGAMSATCS